jgi:hypothetical protein
MKPPARRMPRGRLLDIVKSVLSVGGRRGVRRPGPANYNPLFIHTCLCDSLAFRRAMAPRAGAPVNTS